VRKYAAEQGIAEKDALKTGTEEKSREYAEKGNEIYAKGRRRSLKSCLNQLFQFIPPTVVKPFV